MKSNSQKLSLVVVLSIVALAACGKSGKASEQAAAPVPATVATTPAAVPPAATTTPAPSATTDVREDAKAMKLACADDIKKFCTGADKVGKCLKEHASELSTACSSARQTLRAARKADKAD